jgi:Zn-dependent protease with chaperone function
MKIAPAEATAYIINPLAGRPNQGGAGMSFANLFRTHPPTEDRIARLRRGEW